MEETTSEPSFKPLPSNVREHNLFLKGKARTTVFSAKTQVNDT